MNRLLGIALIALAACSNAQQKQAQNQTQAFASNAPAQTKDAYLQVAVGAKLASIDVDSTSAVHIAAKQGVVTLSGAAKSENEKAAYLDAARAVDGVASVDDALNVDPNVYGAKEGASDAALAAKVVTAIAGQAGVNVFKVNVTARDGRVTLSGRVPSHSIESTILATAHDVQGVTSIDDRLVATK